MGVAFLLRLYRIGAQGLWADEAYSFYLLDSSLRGESGGPVRSLHAVYYFLLWGWMKAAGSSETALRLPSAIFGSLFVLAAAWAGREYFSPSVGIWSGLFAAVSPIHIYYSQEARPYALLMLALLVAQVLLWRAWRANSRKSLMLASTAGFVALGSHPYALLGLLPACLLPLLWRQDGRILSRSLRLVGAITLSVGFLLPLLPWRFLLSSDGMAAATWVRPLWEMTPPMLAIPNSLRVFGLGPERGVTHIFLKQYGTLEDPQWWGWSGVIALLILAVSLALPLGEDVSAPVRDSDRKQDPRRPLGDGRRRSTLNVARCRHRGPGERSGESSTLPKHGAFRDVPPSSSLGVGPGIRHLAARKVWLLALLFLPLGMLWAVSFHTPLYVVGRYDLVGFPPFVVLVGLSLAKIRDMRHAGPVLGPCLALMLCLPIGGKLIRYYQAPERKINHLIARTLNDNVQNGHLVVFTSLAGVTTLYYLNQLGYRWTDGVCENPSAQRRFACRMFPRATERNPGVYSPGRLDEGREAARADLRVFMEPVRGSDAFIWLVFGTFRKDPAKETGIIVEPTDFYLVQELERLGFRGWQVPMFDALGIRPFGRP